MILSVSTPSGGYDIRLQRGSLTEAGRTFSAHRKALIVTDDGVPVRYAEAVAAGCGQASVFTLPQGEATKSISWYQTLLRAMAAADFTRGDCVIAVGGGVVGDLAGFAAATYMRGVDFYNIPTTLLAMVDSSIGGKVAVDLDGIKNLVGAFYPPRGVWVDPDVLGTLDLRQFRAGFVEAVKMALTCDAGLFAELEEKGLSMPAELLIEGALRIKKKVVEQDLTEQGLRRVLNFGHTVGHAVESQQQGRLLHGECVALGMLFFCSPEVRVRLQRLWNQIGLSSQLPATPQQLEPYLRHDKKRAGEQIITVYVDKPGNYEFRRQSVEEILADLAQGGDCR